VDNDCLSQSHYDDRCEDRKKDRCLFAVEEIYADIGLSPNC
jgi:hypothetical protein